MKGITTRQKLSKQNRAIEEVGVRAAGLKIEWIPRIVILLALVLIGLILFKLKILTWFLLVSMNLAFLAYWIHVMKKAKEEKSNENVYYNGTGAAETSTISSKRTVSSKRIFT
jgi:hypothetical protein